MAYLVVLFSMAFVSALCVWYYVRSIRRKLRLKPNEIKAPWQVECELNIVKISRDIKSIAIKRGAPIPRMSKRKKSQTEDLDQIDLTNKEETAQWVNTHCMIIESNINSENKIVLAQYLLNLLLIQDKDNKNLFNNSLLFSPTEKTRSSFKTEEKIRRNVAKSLEISLTEYQRKKGLIELCVRLNEDVKQDADKLKMWNIKLSAGPLAETIKNLLIKMMERSYENFQPFVCVVHATETEDTHIHFVMTQKEYTKDEEEQKQSI